MNVGRLEELRARIQKLAISIILLGNSGNSYIPHFGCSEITGRFRSQLMYDLPIDAQPCERAYYMHPRNPRLPEIWQPATGALLGKLQELAKACNKCKWNVESSKLGEFGLGLASDDSRQVVMLPGSYWARK